MAETHHIPLFPLNTVLLPLGVLPLHVFEERYKEMIGQCLGENQPFGVVLIKEGEEVGEPAIPYEVGTGAHIAQAVPLAEGRMNIVVTGTKRFRILDTVQERPYLVSRVRYWPDPGAVGQLWG
jgi:Lon protease-like protein